MAQRTLIVTTNPKHAALKLKLPNVEVVSYKDKVNFKDLFERLARDYGAERVTIQSGGTLNATLVREGLIDRLLLVVAPAMIGGENTATLMDGESLRSTKDLKKIKTLQLIQAKPLKDSYLLLEYEVRN
jgi:2,5-diamino-6-(ribosylamino)-4(3H)-pyrimidinone 5'-phosphate reductase